MMMKFCSHCAAEVEYKMPDGDNRKRFVCSSCATIFYQNPNIVAGTLPIFDGDEEVKVLLCRRAISPRQGYWTLPAGFMENGESTDQAAARETREEALAEVNIGSLFSMISVPHIDQVHLFFLANLTHKHFGAGQETEETQLFRERDIPWDDIAFPTVSRTLKLFFHHQHDKAALDQCHHSTILPTEALRKAELEENK